MLESRLDRLAELMMDTKKQQLSGVHAIGIFVYRNAKRP